MVYARRKKLYGPLFQGCRSRLPVERQYRNRVYSALFRNGIQPSRKADIWLIKSFHVSELSYRTLQKEYAPYARFKAFREKKIYGCDSSRCNYYEETPFRPDLLLEELAALFHPGLFPDYRFRYYQPLSE